MKDGGGVLAVAGRLAKRVINDGLFRGAGVALVGVVTGWVLHENAAVPLPTVTLDPVLAVAVVEPPPDDQAIIEALLPFYRIDGLSDSTLVALLGWLEHVEGYRSHVYHDDIGDVMTIGIGSNLDTGPGIPRAVAVHWALAVLQSSCNTFSHDWPPFLGVPEPLRAGFCDASYQLGPGGLEGFHNTLASVADGRCADAVKGIEGSDWADDTRNRAERLAHLVQQYGCQPVTGD